MHFLSEVTAWVSGAGFIFACHEMMVGKYARAGLLLLLSSWLLSVSIATLIFGNLL